MKPRLVSIDSHAEGERGITSVLEYGNESLLPFQPKRVFYIYGVQRDMVRGGHGHKRCEQFLIAVRGTVNVQISEQHFVLNSPGIGLYIPPMNISYQHFITDDAVLLVLASDIYDTDDYIYERG